MNRMILILGAGLIGLMHPAAAHATLLDFTFSFTGTVPPGSVAGTVTGEIFGLTEGASSSATNVIVVSYPVGLEPPSPPQTVFSGIVSNAFEVDSSGAVTGAAYLSIDNSVSLSLSLGLLGLNALGRQTTPFPTTENELGFAGATYTLVHATPEPPSVTILGTGLALAALWQLRQRRRRWAVA